MQQSSAPDFDELRAFIALADAGSFAAAARRIGRDPAIVSRRLQSLEKRLAIRLAERSTRRVALTEAGRAYLGQVRPLLRALEEADQEASALAGGEPQGHLRITVPGSFGQMWLRPLIVSFLAAHPRVTIEIEASNRFVDLIGERYDLAIRLGVMPDSRLVARKIAERRRLLVAAPALLARHPAVTRPSDLATLPCLCATSRADPYLWTFVSPDHGTASVAVSSPLASDDAGLLAEAAVAGLGILSTTSWYVARELADGRLVEVMPGWSVADRGAVYLVTPASQGLPSKTRAFADWITPRFATPPWEAP
jgi:DNA-binding transcriptional LysR family regulator